jgi:hypothetical protein
MPKLLPLYTTDDGQPVVTHSMLKSMGRCPRQTMYKYYERLKPKRQNVHLKRGVWVHELLEQHYLGNDWHIRHTELTEKFDELFDEEKEMLGDLPGEIGHIMQAYFWHYRDDVDWEVLETEFTLETELPDGTLYRARVDNLVETPYGLYIVDHKSHKSLPNSNFRLLDRQSALYIWAAKKMGIDVQGFIWNYIKWYPPKGIKFNKDGSMSKRQGDMDYPTAYRSIREQGYDPKSPEWRAFLKPLYARRYKHGEMQLSPFFRRDTLEKDDGMLLRVLRETTRTVRRMHTYGFDRTDYVERVVDRSCDYFCSYQDLCISDLVGGNSDLIRRSQFRVGDPLDYYRDDKEEPAK